MLGTALPLSGILLSLSEGERAFLLELALSVP